MVRRDQWDTYWGPKKVFLVSRCGGGRGHRPALPAESCQSLSNRSPRGRLGSVLYTCKRLRRMRRRFKHFWPISLSSPRGHSNIRPILLPGLSESPRLLQRWRVRRRRLLTTRPTPRALQEPIYPRKKCAIWTRWRSVPGKNANYLRAPSSRRSGLVGPYTTPTIVNYEYMPSTL